MKKIYKLSNIHCADCARSLEEVIRDFEGVKSASINFVTEKFELEIADDKFDVVLDKVKKLIKDFSKDVVMSEYNTNMTINNVDTISFLIKGVDCANCAKNIEDTLCKLNEVNAASFNIVQGKLKLELNVKADDVLIRRIISLIKNIEPGVKIKEHANNDKKKVELKSILYILGLIPLVLIILTTWTSFTISPYLYWPLLIGGAFLLGYQTYVTAIKMLFNKSINENLLVTVSVLGAIIIGEHMEALMVIALYTLGKILEAKAVNKSRKDIQALMNIRPEHVVVLRDGKEEEINPSEVKLGDVIVVKPGQKVAIDGTIVSGECYVDAKSLTGEAEPIFKSVGQDILSGVTVIDGRLEIKTTTLYQESTVSKILDLIEKASEKKSKTETFIAKFSKYYTLLVVGLAVVTGLITGFVLKDVSEAFYRGLIFLVISCPCAFAISVPLSYFSGIGNASRKGILIKGTNYLDNAANAKIVAFDKTGTLTTGEFQIKEVVVVEDVYSKEEIIELAAIGEQNSIHPIAKAIVNANKGKNLPKAENFKEIAGQGIKYEVDGTEYFVGRDNSEDNSTLVVVKKGNITLGKIYMEDMVKGTSKSAAIELKKLGVKTIILSGDKEEVAKKVGETLEVDEVKAELLPQDKYEFIENTIKNSNKKNKFIYVGDGINDAPSLAIADVGVSMGINGSPASIESSDVVLVDDDPSKLPKLIKLSKFTKKIVIQNIAFATIIKATFLLLGALGLANMVMAVFADVGVTILAIFNSLRVLKYEDNKNKKK